MQEILPRDKCWCGKTLFLDTTCSCQKEQCGKTYADNLIELGDTIVIIRHTTLEDAVLTMLPSKYREEAKCSPESLLIGAADSGDGKEYTVREFIDTIREFQNCWGFARQSKNEIHLWIGEKADFVDVLGVLAHEFGHFEPLEDHTEYRSDSYSRVTIRAFTAMNEVGFDITPIMR